MQTHPPNPLRKRSHLRLLRGHLRLQLLHLHLQLPAPLHNRSPLLSLGLRFKCLTMSAWV